LRWNSDEPAFQKTRRLNRHRLRSFLAWTLMGWLVGIGCVSHTVNRRRPAQLTNQPPAASQVGDDSTAQLTLAWLKHTVREPYERVGKKDPRWDTAARKTLDEYVLALRPGGDPDGSRIKFIGGIAHEAVKAGCNDPLIAYLDIRFGDK